MAHEDVKRIETILNEADDLYYNFGASKLTDAEYDSLVDKLRVLNPKNKRFKDKKVGAKEDINSAWEKYNHEETKMGSQSKVNSEDAFYKWASKYAGEGFNIQEKLDGTSIKLIYENGELKVAATRGDGLIGDEISRNVRKMNGVPSKIKCTKTVKVRGEILLYKSNFDRVGGKNTRNSAAGTAKRLDGKGCEWLNVKVYDIMNWEELGLTNNSDVCDFLKKQGFDVVDYTTVYTKELAQEVMNQYKKSKRKTLDWDIDGLVIKVDKIGKDDWEHPNRSIAYKFPSEGAVSTLLSVEWNDSGGRICPTAVFEPVDIMGSTVGRATLNNIDHIKSLDIAIGDQIYVTKRNDVIPCVEHVTIKGTNRKPIIAPTHDKDGYPIVHEKNSEGKELVYLVTTNPNSQSKNVRSILAWFTAHDTKGIAEATIISVLESGLATDLPSFYDLCMNGNDKLFDIDGFGKGTYKIMKQAALKTSKTTLVKFLEGLDLQGFSEKRFVAIFEHFNKKFDLAEFEKVIDNDNNIATIPGFGSNTAKSLKESYQKVKKISDAMYNRVSVDAWEPGKINTGSKIAGLAFCFTGTMSVERSALEKMVKENGGIVAGVSKNLNYLVTNDPNSGSGKNEKADKLGIKKISESEFLALIK